MARPSVRLLQCFLTTSSAVLLAACGGDHPQTTFEPVTEFGREINSLFANTFWWTVGILALVEVLILVFVYRYRERPGTPKPRQIHGNVKLEFLWTVIPAVIVLFIAIPTIRTVFSTQRPAPEGALTVEVIGHQWWWEFRYPEYGFTTANELVLPVGRAIDLKMHSADVIHSFWVPRIGGKRDVNPQPRPTAGERAPRSNHLGFTIEEPGYYLGQCAEFCGASHAIMRTAIVALEADDFMAWVSSMGGRQGTPPLPQPVPGAADALPPGAPVDTTTPSAGQPGERRDTLSVADTTGQSRPTAIPPAAQAPTPVQDTTVLSPEAARGKQLFTTKVCIACHTIRGTSAAGLLGPSLTRFGARRYVGAGARPNTVENVIDWITNPQAVKPGALMPGASSSGGGMAPTNLTPDEVRAIATYLTSLK